MSEEWGPWIEHDGKGCPVPVGVVIQYYSEGYPGDVRGPREGTVKGGKSWDWRYWTRYVPGSGCFASRIVRYRVRIPRALIELRQMIENLPEGVDA